MGKNGVASLYYINRCEGANFAFSAVTVDSKGSSVTLGYVQCYRNATEGEETTDPPVPTVNFRCSHGRSILYKVKVICGLEEKLGFVFKLKRHRAEYHIPRKG